MSAFVLRKRARRAQARRSCQAFGRYCSSANGMAAACLGSRVPARAGIAGQMAGRHPQCIPQSSARPGSCCRASPATASTSPGRSPNRHGPFSRSFRWGRLPPQQRHPQSREYQSSCFPKPPAKRPSMTSVAMTREIIVSAAIRIPPARDFASIAALVSAAPYAGVRQNSPMPNIAALLKQEIGRIARKESKGEVEALRRATAGYRKQIAQLKRRMDSLERQLKAVNKAGARAASPPAENEEGPTLRFRPDGLRKHRERLGLSAADVAKILGCSQLSVYKWESGKTRPRLKQLEAIAQLRRLGRREAAARLAESA